MLQGYWKIPFLNLIFLPIFFLSGNGAFSEDDLVHLRKVRLWGTAISEYQVSGSKICKHSNWSNWEQKRIHRNHPTILDNDWSLEACNFWDNYEYYIELLQELGCNSFRFSIEWTVIEPECGNFSQEALDHYIELCNALINAGIEPIVTLHHFTHPAWFENIGGFTKEKNIKYFVRFSKYVFHALQDRVRLWCTINEIGPFVFMGYIMGSFPPGVHNLHMAARVMRTMLKAHCRVYKALKKMSLNPETHIGLVHQYCTFEPHDTSLLGKCNLLEQVPAYFMTYVFNSAILHFLRTGVLFPHNPLLRLNIPDAPQCFDFIGLNLYSRIVLKSHLKQCIKTRDFSDIVKPMGRNGELMTDMPYPICPESLYNAIVDLSSLNVPIYITENGLADAQDNRRGLFITAYLKELARAIKDGYDVRGYFFWSLIDNFEWAEGYSKKFGLYRYNPLTGIGELKDGAKVYQALLRNMSLYITGK
jgi:beta-glucosidase